jgi:hypothetical protein
LKAIAVEIEAGEGAAPPNSSPPAAPLDGNSANKEIAVATKLKCEKCGFETAMPTHCNRPMHSELVGAETRLVCWMGPSCGAADLPMHCGAPMQAAA